MGAGVSGCSGIEGQRALGELVGAGVLAVEPGVAISDAPGEDGLDGGIGEDGGEIALVGLGDGTIAAREVGREGSIVDVRK
jgi:hypothetical protein